MKKIILFLFALLLLASPTFAASYYGCAGAAINADSTFCATPTGSCAGNDPVTAATALAGTHTLYANGCTITIPESFTATAISNADGDGAGAAVGGGGYTLDTATVSGKTITANVTAGAVGTACLTISGAGAGTPVDTIVGTVTGGTVNSADGVLDTHTVGTIALTGSIVGGSAGASAYGYELTGTGPVTVSGNCTSTMVASGLRVNAASGSGVTVAGNCVGNNAGYGAGCASANTTTAITVSGNLIFGETGSAISASVIWTPGATTNYAMFPKDGSYTVGTNDEHAIMCPATNSALGGIATVTNVLSGVTYGTLTGTAASGGGGGAWGF
jgi:hypothetical protein